MRLRDLLEVGELDLECDCAAANPRALAVTPNFDDDFLKRLVAHLITHYPADADPAGLGQGFEPRRDIDPVTIDIEPVLHNVAEIDPHAELDAAIRRHVGVSLCHLALHFDGATHRVDDAGKLDEQTVARSLDDATAMFLDFWDPPTRA